MGATDRRSNVKVLIPQISEDIVEDMKIVPQEKFKERICDQIVDVPVRQVDVFDALQFQVRAISHEIQEKCSDVYSSKKEFLTETHELKCSWVNAPKRLTHSGNRNQGSWARSWIAFRRALSKKGRS